MDDPQVKRLVITLAVSIAIIMVLKMVLVRTATRVSAVAAKPAAEQNHTAPGPEAVQPVAPVAAPAAAVN